MINNLIGIHPSRMGFHINPEEKEYLVVLKNLKKRDDNVPMQAPQLFEEFNVPPNQVVCIYAGYSCKKSNKNILNTSPEIMANYLKKVHGGRKIIFENVFEGGVDDVIGIIHWLLDMCPEIESKNVYYLTGSINVDESYAKYCNTFSIPSNRRINTASACLWEFAAHHRLNHIGVGDYEIRKKDKLLLCFNRVNRLHRFLLLCLFFKHQLLDKSYYSYFPGASHGAQTSEDTSMINSIRYILPNDDFIEELIQEYIKNKHILPLKLNITPDFNKVWLDNDDIQLFSNSYLSLVTETFFFNRKQGQLNLEDAIFPSEKTFKPISMKHPFIMLNRPMTLACLRKMGYRTFHPFINETYDTIINNKERLNAIMEEVLRLSKYTDEEWIEWQKNVKEIVEHNYNILKSKTNFVYERNYV